MLFYAWQQAGTDPYQLYNDLDADYRPIGQPNADPRPPQFPERVKAVVYAFAMYARELARKDAMEQAQATGHVARGGKLR